MLANECIFGEKLVWSPFWFWSKPRPTSWSCNNLKCNGSSFDIFNNRVMLYTPTFLHSFSYSFMWLSKSPFDLERIFIGFESNGCFKSHPREWGNGYEKVGVCVSLVNHNSEEIFLFRGLGCDFLLLNISFSAFPLINTGNYRKRLWTLCLRSRRSNLALVVHYHQREIWQDLLNDHMLFVFRGKGGFWSNAWKSLLL